MREVCVIAAGALNVLPDADDGRKVKGVQRAQLSGLQLAGGIYDRLVDRQQRDRGTRGARAA